jgi:hypothetical protein
LPLHIYGSSVRSILLTIWQVVVDCVTIAPRHPQLLLLDSYCLLKFRQEHDHLQPATAVPAGSRGPPEAVRQAWHPTPVAAGPRPAAPPSISADGPSERPGRLHELSRNGKSHLRMPLWPELYPSRNTALVGVVKLRLVECGRDNLLLGVKSHLFVTPSIGGATSWTKSLYRILSANAANRSGEPARHITNLIPSHPFAGRIAASVHTQLAMERPRSATETATPVEALEIIRRMAVRYGDDQIASVLCAPPFQ